MCRLVVLYIMLPKKSHQIRPGLYQKLSFTGIFSVVFSFSILNATDLIQFRWVLFFLEGDGVVISIVSVVMLNRRGIRNAMSHPFCGFLRITQRLFGETNMLYDRNIH